MRYLHLLSWVASTAWAMEPVKAQTILGVLLNWATGKPQAWFDDGDDRQVERDARRTAELRAQADRGGIAILPLHGVIASRAYEVSGSSTGPGISAEGFAAAIRQAVGDASVTGIVIDMDSPGGSVAGIQEAAQVVRDAAAVKPVVALANHWSASAAYWLASAAPEIVVTPSGEVGSIGVYQYHEDISKALEIEGVVPTLIKAGEFKAEGHPAFALGEEAVAYMQTRVDNYYDAFVRDVAKGRGVSVATVRESFGGGRMVGAAEAVSLGMADRVDTLDGVIKRMQRQITAAHRKSSEDRRRRLAVA